MESKLNIHIWKLQLFSTDLWWVGFGRFENSMAKILEWDLGLGYLRLRKWV